MRSQVAERLASCCFLQCSSRVLRFIEMIVARYSDIYQLRVRDIVSQR